MSVVENGRPSATPDNLFPFMTGGRLLLTQTDFKTVKSLKL